MLQWIGEKSSQAKEEQIEYLEDLSEKLMKKIEAYKQKTSQNYLKKSDQLKIAKKSTLLTSDSIFSEKFLDFKPVWSIKLIKN